MLYCFSPTLRFVGFEAVWFSCELAALRLVVLDPGAVQPVQMRPGRRTCGVQRRSGGRTRGHVVSRQHGLHIKYQPAQMYLTGKFTNDRAQPAFYVLETCGVWHFLQSPSRSSPGFSVPYSGPRVSVDWHGLGHRLLPCGFSQWQQIRGWSHSLAKSHSSDAMILWVSLGSTAISVLAF